jgi:hypothetical protein
MEFKFELHTTISEPLYIIVDSSNVTLKQLHHKLISEIEKNTIFTKEDILDIFVTDNLSLETMSMPSTDESLVRDFIPMNRNFFPFGLITKNTYKIYAIDRMYNERLKNAIKTKDEHKIRSREIKTSHYNDIKNFTKKFISLW